MFKRLDGKLVCVIHPDVERTFKTVEVKKGYKSVHCCEKCDQLVEELRGKNEHPAQ